MSQDFQEGRILRFTAGGMTASTTVKMRCENSELVWKSKTLIFFLACYLFLKKLVVYLDFSDFHENWPGACQILTQRRKLGVKKFEILLS